MSAYRSSPTLPAAGARATARATARVRYGFSVLGPCMGPRRGGAGGLHEERRKTSDERQASEAKSPRQHKGPEAVFLPNPVTDRALRERRLNDRTLSSEALFGRSAGDTEKRQEILNRQSKLS